MTKITDQIWIGNSQDAATIAKIKSNGINAILNCAFDLSDRFGWDQGIVLSHCGLIDGPGNPVPAYYSAVFGLANLIKQGKTILVHCHVGESRSVSIVMMYLNTIERHDWDYWRAHINKIRPLSDYAPHAAHKAVFCAMDFDFIARQL